MRRTLTLSLVAMALVSGCTKEPESTTTTEKPGGAKLRIAFIPKNLGNPYFDDVKSGLDDACKELGADLHMIGPAKAEATSQISFIQDQVQQGVDVIVLSANSPDALNATLDEARKKGVVVVTVDSDLTGNEDHRDTGVLPVNQSDVGPQQLELLGSLIGYEGDFAILSATTDAPNQNLWIAGMKKALNDPKYAKMKLVATVYGNDQSEKSTSEFEGLVAKYQNLRGVIAPTSVGLAAAAQSLELSGMYAGGPNAKGAGLELTGLSTPNQLKKAIDKGIVKSFALWSPHDMGYIAAYVGVAIKNKKIEAKPGTKFEAGKLGEKQIGDKNVVIAGPMTVFSKDNIGKYNF